MDPASKNFQLAVSAAQYEVAYGVIFGLIGVIVLIFGVLGGRHSKQKSSEDRYGKTIEDNTPTELSQSYYSYGTKYIGG
ncbi:MAG: hypothetical protein ACYCQJ_03320 [Nitrososphaerales archaeon]